MKKIALIVYDLRGGGIERTVLNTLYVANYFSKKKIKVELIVFNKKNDYTKHYSKKLLKQIKYFNENKLNFVGKVIQFFYLFILLHKLNYKQNYDLYILCEPITWFLTIFIRLFLNKKVVLILQTPIKNYLIYQNPIMRFLYKILFFNLYICNHILCPSYGLKYDLTRYTNKIGNKITVIPNFVNFKKIKFEFKKNNDVLACGRLVKQKGFDHLIKSFKFVVNNIPKARMIILGDGSERKNLEYLIKNLHLNRNIKLIKFRNPIQYYQKTKIFVSSSLYEGFGNVIIEAMAYGLPMIATDCDYGPKEIISGKRIIYPYKKTKTIKYEKYGILCPQFDFNDTKKESNEKILGKEITKMLSDSDRVKKYSEMSILRSKNYEAKKIVKLYVAFFKKISH